MTGTVSRLMRIDCWSTYGSRAGGEQLSQGFWTGRRGLTLASFSKLHWSVVFQNLGVKSFLEERLDDRRFERRWEKAGVQSR